MWMQREEIQQRIARISADREAESRRAHDLQLANAAVREAAAKAREAEANVIIAQVNQSEVHQSKVEELLRQLAEEREKNEHFEKRLARFEANKKETLAGTPAENVGTRGKQKQMYDA